MNSRAILLAELEEKRSKNKELAVETSEIQASVAGLGEGYDPYDNPGTHKSSRPDGKALRRFLRRP